MDEVNAASHYQICKWSRFLDSPGMCDIGRDDCYEIMDREAKIMNRIVERRTEGGGFTPAISKSLGWGS